MSSAQRRRFQPSRIVITVAVLAVVMAFGQIANATGSTVRRFTASVSPSCVTPGSTLTYTATLTNSPSSSSGQVITSGFFHSTVKTGISNIRSFSQPVASNGRQWVVLPDLIDADGFTLVAKSSSQGLRPGETVTVTWSGTAALNSSGTTFAMLVLGTGVFSGTGPSVSFASPCPATSLKIGAAPGGGAIGTQVAGAPFNIQITAVDANGQTATGFNGTAQLQSTPAGLAGAPLSVPLTAGVSGPISITMTSAGSFTLTATSSTISGTISGTSAPAFAVTSDANLSCTSSNPADRSYSETNNAGTLSVTLTSPGDCTTSVPVTVDVSTPGTAIVTKPDINNSVYSITMDWTVPQDTSYPLFTSVDTGSGDQPMVFCNSGPTIPSGKLWCVTDSHTFFQGAIKKFSETYLGTKDVTFKRHP